MMNIKTAIGATLFFAIFISVAIWQTSCVLALGDNTLTIKLPQNLSEVDFNNGVPYYGELNGNQIKFSGIPFLKDNITYIPVRDLGDAFGVTVKYNPDDRHVILLTSGEMIAISPQTSFSESGTAVIKAGETDISEQKYLLINNRSYLPLRFVMETFGYIVKYDPDRKQIEISGTTTSPAEENHFVSDEQKIVIDALSSFEGARNVEIIGTVTLNGSQKSVKVELTRVNDNTIKEINDVIADGAHFRGEKEMPPSGSISYSLFEISNDNTKNQINLIGWGSTHPYLHFGDLELTGIVKYSSLIINDMGATNGIQNYKVSIKQESDKTFELGVDVETNKLKSYISRLSDGSIDKEFQFTY
jgi:hypothetical protein